MTFSIVGWDPANRDGAEWGVAVASKFLAVGSVVPWARADAGAVATQALANVSYGPQGLALLSSRSSAEEVVADLVAADEDREHRQLGVVDGTGRSATYTGTECLPWAGGIARDGFCCQGNILAGPAVVDAMAEAFAGPGDLGARLLAALHAGDRAGGDRRGRQSAALLVVRDGGGYLGDTDVTVDLRVDDHPDPVIELARLLELHRLLFPAPASLEFIDIDDGLAMELRTRLRRRSLFDGPSAGAVRRRASDGALHLRRDREPGAAVERRAPHRASRARCAANGRPARDVTSSVADRPSTQREIAKRPRPRRIDTAKETSG